MRRKLIIFIGIVILISLGIILAFNFYYPVNISIDQDNVKAININYYGDGFQKTITDEQEINEIIGALNNIRLRKSKDMSHLSPRSGALAITLYDSQEKAIDYFFFYTRLYRGGQADGLDMEEGKYYIFNELQRDNLYDICDKLCGDPFNRLR